MKQKIKIPARSMALLCSFMLIVAAQLNINLFISEFKISLAVILFPLFYFLLEKFPVILTTLLMTPGILIVRCVGAWFQNVPLSSALQSYGPEVVFYLVYGLLFWMLTRVISFHHFKWSNFVLLGLIDLLSNVAELLLRPEIDPFHMPVVTRIALIAVGRAILSAVLLGGLAMYGAVTLHRDERDRYKKMLLLISRMKGEMIWMEKNTVAIEDTMTVSYQLYHDLKQFGSEELAQKALTVAKDIHEIKKEYRLIMKGLSEALNKDMEEKGMWLSSVLEVIRESCSSLADTYGKNVQLKIKEDCEFYTEKHYYLLSILRNLLTNAIEAQENMESCAHLELLVERVGTMICFRVKDDCGGIDQNYVDAIFLPGFSTKFNEETGEVNRGLGLALVKDMVDEELGGTISMISEQGGTEFIIEIPAANLEV